MHMYLCIMGNVVSTVCITGAALAIVVKPVCEYTIRTVLDRASTMIGDKLAVVEQDVKRAVDLVEKVGMLLSKDGSENRELKADVRELVDEVSVLLGKGLETCAKDKLAMLDKILSEPGTDKMLDEVLACGRARTEDGKLAMLDDRVLSEAYADGRQLGNHGSFPSAHVTLYKAREGDDKFAMLDKMDKMLESVEKANDILSTFPKVELAVFQTAEGIAAANVAISKLPEAIDRTAKVYSNHLHDEHVSIFELVSAKKGF